MNDYKRLFLIWLNLCKETKKHLEVGSISSRERERSSVAGCEEELEVRVLRCLEFNFHLHTISNEQGRRLLTFILFFFVPSMCVSVLLLLLSVSLIVASCKKKRKSSQRPRRDEDDEPFLFFFCFVFFFSVFFPHRLFKKRKYIPDIYREKERCHRFALRYASIFLRSTEKSLNERRETAKR